MTGYPHWAEYIIKAKLSTNRTPGLAGLRWHYNFMSRSLSIEIMVLGKIDKQINDKNVFLAIFEYIAIMATNVFKSK